MKNEGTTKKEQQDLLLRETEKTLQKELSHLKKRKILTSEELIKMKEDWQWWDERQNMKKKLTPLEWLQFNFMMDRKHLGGKIVERMILNCKPGPYTQSLKELDYFDIHVWGLLSQIIDLKEERDLKITEKNSLEKTIKIQEDSLNAKEYLIKLKEKIIKLQEERIRRYEDCNTDQTNGPLRIVFNKNLN